MLSYFEEMEIINGVLREFLGGRLCELPIILLGESGSGKSNAIREALEASNHEYFPILPRPDMTYQEQVNKIIQGSYAKFSKERFENLVFWFDEVHHWPEFRAEWIQAEKGFLEFESVKVAFKQMIFSGHTSILENASEKARLRQFSCPTPNRKDIFKALLKSGLDSTTLGKAVEYASCSFHEVRNRYDEIKSGIRLILNPFGLSDGALRLLNLFSENPDAPITALKNKLGTGAKGFRSFERELDSQGLIHKDGVKRSVSKLGYAVIKAPKLDTAPKAPEAPKAPKAP